MQRTRHAKVLLVMVAEAALEKRLVQDARERGAQGWTASEVRGGGHGGVREGAWEADRSVEIRVICDPAVAEAIAQHALDTYAPHYGLTLYLGPVDVWRPERY